MNIVVEQLFEEKMKFVKLGDNVNMIAYLVFVKKENKKYFIFISGMLNKQKVIKVEVNKNEYEEAKIVNDCVLFAKINIGGWITYIDKRIGVKCNKLNVKFNTLILLIDWYKFVIKQYQFIGQNILNIPKKYEQRWIKESQQYRNQFIIKWNHILNKIEKLQFDIIFSFD